jgi:hypothetical protein
MSSDENLSRELMDQNGLADEALAEIRKQQARSVVLAEKRKVGRIRALCIAAWALTAMVIFASMALSVLLFSTPPSPDVPRLVAFSASMLGMFGMVAFVVAIVTSVAWYFSARTASLKAIDVRLGQLEAILRAEADKSRPEGARAEETSET